MFRSTRGIFWAAARHGAGRAAAPRGFALWAARPRSPGGGAFVATVDAPREGKSRVVPRQLVRSADSAWDEVVRGCRGAAPVTAGDASPVRRSVPFQLPRARNNRLRLAGIRAQSAARKGAGRAPRRENRPRRGGNVSACIRRRRHRRGGCVLDKKLPELRSGRCSSPTVFTTRRPAE